MVTDPSQNTDPTPSAVPFVCVNGTILRVADARISILDHGLLYGDGLFETLRIVAGRCFQVEAHLDRLFESAGRLALSLPWSREELREALADTIAANRADTGALRLTVTRGAGEPIPSPAVCAEPAFFVTLRAGAASAGSAAPDGIRLALGQEHPRLFVPAIKSLCYLPYQVARSAALAAGFDDALLQHSGNAVETCVSNLFVVTGGEVSTPGLDSGCLAGVTRALILRLCRETGVATTEGPLPISGATRADEAFVTNSVQGVVAVTAMGHARIGDGRAGRTTQALQLAFAKELERFAG